MKQVLIDNNIEAIAQDYKNLFEKDCKTEILSSINLLLKNLDIKDQEYAIKKIYLENIIINYSLILTLRPDEMIIFFSKFILPPLDKNFYKDIVSSMRYDIVRKKYMLLYVKKLEINCCAYCHTQNTNIVNEYYKRAHNGNKKGDIKNQKGFFELDHYYPKSRYPFLCTSFYNLIPICSSCNKSKKDKSIDFEFYHISKMIQHGFKFRITKNSIIKYKTTLNKNDIEIDFYHPNKKYLEKYNNLFSIQLKYSEFKDIAEELIYKEMKYNDIYVKSVINTFGNNQLDPSLTKRIILGNYCEDDEVLKRPLAKFYQEIGLQLKII